MVALLPFYPMTHEIRVFLFRWRVPPRVISVRDESPFEFTQSRDTVGEKRLYS